MQRTTRPHGLKQCAHVTVCPFTLESAVFTTPVTIYMFIQPLLTGLSPHLHGKHRGGVGTWPSWFTVGFPAPKTGQVLNE